jgi:hypothetical protein
MAEFTFEEKMICVRREITFRRRVYSHKVREGTMSQQAADREIALMISILRDLETLSEGTLL